MLSKLNLKLDKTVRLLYTVQSKHKVYFMTKRTYTQKDGTIWEWDETPELLQLLKELHANNQTPSTGSNNSLV